MQDDSTTKEELEEISTSEAQAPELQFQVPQIGVTKYWSDDEEETVPLREYDEEYFSEGEEDKGEISEEILEESNLTPEERDKLLASKLALEHEWVFWYDDKLPKGMSTDRYESAVKSLGKFATVQVY
jgi:hypothetical protein